MSAIALGCGRGLSFHPTHQSYQGTITVEPKTGQRMHSIRQLLSHSSTFAVPSPSTGAAVACAILAAGCGDGGILNYTSFTSGATELRSSPSVSTPSSVLARVTLDRDMFVPSTSSFTGGVQLLVVPELASKGFAAHGSVQKGSAVSIDSPASNPRAGMLPELRASSLALGERIDELWQGLLSSAGKVGKKLTALISDYSSHTAAEQDDSPSSPDFTVVSKNDGCLRTDDAAYNAQVEQLAVKLFGRVPTAARGCMTTLYLENKYSRYISSVRNHAGIDFRAAAGTPVLSPIAGMVVKRQLNRSDETSTLTIEGVHNGQHVRVIFLHCQGHNHFRRNESIGELVEGKSNVEVGDQVCQSGSVGADAAHLHVEVKLPGQDRDNLLAMSGSRGACKTSSFRDGWDKNAKVFTKLVKPGCNLFDVRNGTIDPTGLISNPRLVTPTSIGPVRKGMTLEQARKLLRGATLERSESADGLVWVAVKAGGVDQFYIYAGEEDQEAPIQWDKRIEELATFNPLYHTAEGVHPGSRVQDVEAIYGRVESIFRGEIESRQYVYFSDEPKGLTFRLNYTGIFPENSRETTKFESNAEIYGMEINGDVEEGENEVAGGGATADSSQVQSEVSAEISGDQATLLERAVAAIQSSNAGSRLAKETAIGGLKLAVELGYSEVLQRFVWEQFELNGALLVNLILQNPQAAAQAALEAVPSAAYSFAAGAAVPVAASLLTDAVFRSETIAVLPTSLHTPLKALLESALIETVGVGMGAVTGHPAALVGPVVDRIIDLCELYATVGALGRTLDDGLVATAFGVEASAHLGVDFQDRRSQAVARSVYDELNQRLGDIVGTRFEAEVREIYRLGHRALVAQRRGDAKAATSYVEAIKRKGELAQGVHPFSAVVSPGFWVDVVSHGGVSPVKRAAIVIIMATSLRNLPSHILRKQ